MKRQSTTSAAELWAKLASRDHVALMPERLLWPRPLSGVRIEQAAAGVLRLPRQVIPVPVNWPEALADFSSEKIAADRFAQKHGLLLPQEEMKVAVFDYMRVKLRGFLAAGKGGSAALANYLRKDAPPIAVQVEIQEHQDSVEILLVPHDLLSGLWLIAIRASFHNIKPVRVCALVGCEKPLTGTARKDFCCNYHRTRATKRPDLDKRRLRDRLKGIDTADLEALASVWQEAQRRIGK